MAERYLSEFASALDDAISSTAKDAGLLDDYTSAVNEYRQAMKLNDLWEATKQPMRPHPQVRHSRRGHGLCQQERRQQMTAQGELIMSHTPKQMALRPQPRKLDQQLATLDRSHQARQNAKSQPVNLDPPKGPKPR